MAPFFIFGGILLLVGVIITAANLKNFRRRQRILQTPTSPIAQAPGAGPVEVKGRIVPGEQGVLQTPFSGRHAVWCRITVLEHRSSGRNSYWATIIKETDQREFFVDDGSGQMAKIVPHGAEVILDAQNVASSGTFNDASPHLQGFLASRGHSTQTFLGFNKSMRYTEEVLSPNDPLYALGPSRREAGPPVNDGYRMAPSSQLVLGAGHGEAHELILTNKTEEQLVSRLLWGFVGGLICVGVSLVCGAIGLIFAIAEMI
ncbi:MAG: hypothetical protein IPQ09_09420 [Myxococcales bacterium]|nr:hypothetical protein [Myxococcales bacterium]